MTDETKPPLLGLDRRARFPAMLAFCVGCAVFYQTGAAWAFWALCAFALALAALPDAIERGDHLKDKTE